MKQNQIVKTSNEFQELSLSEMHSIEGGSLIRDLFYLAGATLRCIREFTKTAAEYQASLPPSLKK